MSNVYRFDFPLVLTEFEPTSVEVQDMKRWISDVVVPGMLGDNLSNCVIAAKRNGLYLCAGVSIENNIVTAIHALVTRDAETFAMYCDSISETAKEQGLTA